MFNNLRSNDVNSPLFSAIYIKTHKYACDIHDNNVFIRRSKEEEEEEEAGKSIGALIIFIIFQCLSFSPILFHTYSVAWIHF